MALMNRRNCSFLSSSSSSLSSFCVQSFVDASPDVPVFILLSQHGADATADVDRLALKVTNSGLSECNLYIYFIGVICFCPTATV